MYVEQPFSTPFHTEELMFFSLPLYVLLLDKLRCFCKLFSKKNPDAIGTLLLVFLLLPACGLFHPCFSDQNDSLSEQ